MNEQDIGVYLTKKQYDIAPVQAHTHNGVDSIPVNSSTLSGIPILYGTGTPDTRVPAAKGTLYVRLDGSGDGSRIYINTNGNKSWTGIRSDPI